MLTARLYRRAGAPDAMTGAFVPVLAPGEDAVAYNFQLSASDTPRRLSVIYGALWLLAVLQNTEHAV